MKTIVSFNLGNFSSTGNIMKELQSISEQNNFTHYCFYPDSESNNKIGENDYIIEKKITRKINEKLAYYTGMNGCFAWFSTLKVLKKLNKLKPDIIHLHNLHNSYINLSLLFKYIKKKNISVIWTLHDCWAFTGHCTYFSYIGCNKWKSNCYNCPLYKSYPESLIDTSKIMYRLKKKWFRNVEKMKIVTPSVWLKKLVNESFLNKYECIVINNGINLNNFKPIESDFREKFNIINKKIILGVANPWCHRKGLDIFIKLAKELPVEYKIVLVGTSEEIEKTLPENILTIRRTNSQVELAKIYSAADIFINPTREDNYPTVNLESLACGTPVITFNTGGSPEALNKETGIVVEFDNYNDLKEAIISFVNGNVHIYKDSCLNKAKLFNKEIVFSKYLELYNNL